MKIFRKHSKNSIFVSETMKPKENSLFTLKKVLPAVMDLADATLKL